MNSIYIVKEGRRHRVLRSRPRAVGSGCRWCGADRRGHAQRWVPSHGYHGWEPPTPAQVVARCRARLRRAGWSV